MKGKRRHPKAITRVAASLLLSGVMAALSVGAFAAGRDHGLPNRALEAIGFVKIEGNRPAPDFALNDLSGTRIGPADLRGKVVFLTFWATW